jgi:hypothetical protein
MFCSPDYLPKSRRSEDFHELTQQSHQLPQPKQQYPHTLLSNPWQQAAASLQSVLKGQLTHKSNGEAQLFEQITLQ